ncbi:MAG TPA: 23S rRNA (uracil(1939)-C(5))-methyltransferase RlmD, partial [bacterium]|nr:23S rRNA (uracil(1939)-C(5))-methyltransferase RlmD [bacterium]
MNTHVVKPVQHGDQIELEITSLAFGGDSVGRYQDFAIFVPGGLPGERVRLRITQVKDHYASGEILEILRQSPDRVTPPCAIFEECGGCQWQHFNYPRQLQTKRQFIVDAFQRIGKLPPVAVQPCLPSPDPYGYRNKAMPVISMREGHFISGIYEPRSHKLVPYHNCPIQGDAINDLIQKVLKKVDRSGLTPYQEKKHSGFLRHLAVRQGVKTGEILLAFVTRTPIPEERLQKPTVLAEELDQILPRIARELMEEVPGLVGVLQNINSSRTNIVFGPTTVLLGGRDHYFEVIDELRLKVSLKSFLQVNTRQADTLHTVVREALGDPTSKKKWGTVLDLYSGIGTLSLAVADKADYVVGVEEVAPSVEDAKVNAEINQKVNIDFLEGDVDKILVGLKDKGLNLVDAVLLDPPRKGVLPEVLSRVTAFRPERLVYVSCDPSTLARDLALLTKQGYQVDWAQPLDMFPQTYHVETVVRLTRVEPLPPEVLPENQAALEPFRLPKEAPPLSMNVLARTRPAWERLSESLGVFARAVRLALGLAVLIVAAPFKGAWRVLGALTFAVSSLRQRLKKKPTEPKRLEEVSPVASTEISEAPVTPIATETEEESVRAVIAAPIDRLAVPEPPPELEAPEEKAPAPPRRPRFHLPPLRWEAPWVGSFWNRTLAWGREHRTLRWAMAALLLLGGGFIAKATLSPEAKKTSMLVPTVSQMIPDVIAVMPSRNFLRYEMVPFEVRVNSAELPYFNQMRATVEVYQGGNAINMVDGRSKLSLKKDTSN